MIANNQTVDQADTARARMKVNTFGVADHSQRALAFILIRLFACLFILVSSCAHAALTPTTTTLASSANPAYVDQTVALTATVSPAAATGSVTFKDGKTVVGTSSLSGGSATLSLVYSGAGAHNLTAVYSGSGTHKTSTSSALSQTISARRNASINLTFSQNPIPVGQSETLTAIVSDPSVPPTGTVTFVDGGTVLGTAQLNGGTATLTRTYAAAGTHNHQANYSGDVAHIADSSFVRTLTVNLLPSSTTLSSSATRVRVSDPVTFSANVSPTAATGVVTFKDGSGALGTATLNGGTASFIASFATLGDHAITATYGGDATTAISTSAGMTVTVNNLASTTTVLTASPSPGTVNQPVMFTATVTGSNPTGSVEFVDGNSHLIATPLSGGVATLTTAFSSVGNHSFTAIYSGDANNNPSTSPVFAESIILNPTNTTLSTSANPSSVAQSVVLTATVTGSNPAGTVTLKDGGVVLETGTLSSGVVTFTADELVAGTHTLTAVYSGNAANAGSTSSPVAQVVSGNEMTWLLDYDAQGNVLKKTDPSGSVISFAYDGLRRATTVTQPAAAVGAVKPVVVQGYDDGRQEFTRITDPRGLATNYTVDGLSNITAVASSDSGTGIATFDAAGNVRTTTDARGKTTTYTYDRIDRPINISYQTGTATTFEYDGGESPTPTSVGHLTRITDESGTTSYAYDQLGRVLTKTQQVGASAFTVNYAWGSTGPETDKLIAITYPSGNRVNYGYDATGRVTSVTINPANPNGIGTNTSTTRSVLSGLTYNAESAPQTWTWSDGTTYQRAYDSFGRIEMLSLGNPAGVGAALGLTRTLAYDASGNVTSFVHSNTVGPQQSLDQAFEYDGLNRLTDSLIAGNYFAYSYDQSGNRTHRLIETADYVNTVSANSNRLTHSQAPGPVSRVYTYDAAGNVTADGSATYAYSDRGRMKSATVGGGVVSYLYNGLDQRVSKSGSGALVPTGVNYFLYDEAGQLIGEYGADLTPISETIYLGALPVALMRRSGSAANSTLQVDLYDVYSDHLNTPRVVTRDTDQAIVWRWDASEAFGASAPNENPSGLGSFAFNQRYPGQHADTETGFFYNYFRDYDPATGRYNQSDPIGLLGGINTYAYVGSDPINKVDPIGEQAVLPGLGVLGVGAAIWMSTPTGRDAVANATQSLAKTLQDFCSPGCSEIQEQIERAISQLRIRYVAMTADKNNTFQNNLFGRLGWFNHRTTYRDWQTNLRGNVDRAREINCPYNPEADEWLLREPPDRPAVWRP